MKTSSVYWFAVAALPFLAMFSCSSKPVPPETVKASVRLAAAKTMVGPVMGAPRSSAEALVASFEYKEGSRVDIYWPPAFAFDRRLPLALFAVSIADSRFRKDTGGSATELASYISWCSVAASQGAASAIMTVVEPAKDLAELAAWLKRRQKQLYLDIGRVWIWACSSNWMAASLLTAKGGALEREVAGISLYYTSTSVMTPLPARPVPVEVLIPDKDTPSDMQGLASYASKLKASGHLVHVVHIPGGGHSFDSNYDSPDTIAAVSGTLAFMRGCLGIASP